MKNLNRIDLNLLVYLDVLLRECNVTQAANQLGLSQPAMSNGLRRLRDLFNDPLLVRTSDGMTPTARAIELEPLVRDILSGVDRAIQPTTDFDPGDTNQVVRVMASDYAESTLFPAVLQQLRELAPGLTLDIMTPSDVSFLDVERGKVDLVINRFDQMPQSFHQITLWHDTFSCLLSPENPILENFDLDAYLSANHIWVSKTGMGVGVGVDPDDVQRLGWVDTALAAMSKKRRIRVFTRHYQAAMTLAEQNDLIVTLPTRATWLKRDNPRVVVREVPFHVPTLDLKMAWSPLLQHNPAHRWVRQTITQIARNLGPDGVEIDMQAIAPAKPKKKAATKAKSAKNAANGTAKKKSTATKKPAENKSTTSAAKERGKK